MPIIIGEWLTQPGLGFVEIDHGITGFVRPLAENQAGGGKESAFLACGGHTVPLDWTGIGNGGGGQSGLFDLGGGFFEQIPSFGGIASGDLGKLLVEAIGLDDGKGSQAQAQNDRDNDDNAVGFP